MIYIIGHIKPDLDSAVSAVALKMLFDKIDSFEYKNTKAVLASEANFETKFIFNKFKVSLPSVLKAKEIKSDDKFILVDHNEESQRLKGIKNEQIIDIFDHHKLSLNLPSPIYSVTKPWGSTASIVFWLMELTNVQLEKHLARLLISAVLSDTVGLKSKTTKQRDKNTVKKLIPIAQIKDINKLTFDIFKAKSDLSGLNSEQILTHDYKIYNFGGKKVLINQIETVEQDKMIGESDKYLAQIQQLKKEMKLDYFFNIITDVLKINSKCLVLAIDEKILLSSFKNAKKIKQGVYNLGPIMSRKKEIAPIIEKTIKRK